MESISLPTRIHLDAADQNRATIVIEPCYPGYGTTLGNALRRVLLSSLPGAAVTRIKIKNVNHEFSTLPGVKEDIVDMLLNVKQLRVKIHEGEEATLTLRAKGEMQVKGKDIEVASNVEITNGDHVLATLTDKSSELEMELYVQKGRGYVPVETQEREKSEIGVISVDAIYTPVKHVNFNTEHVRVGQMTNYDKLTLDVLTDGTITPGEAFHQASEILVNHFQLFVDAKLSGEAAPKKASKKKAAEAAEEAE